MLLSPGQSSERSSASRKIRQQQTRFWCLNSSNKAQLRNVIHEHRRRCVSHCSAHCRKKKQKHKRRKTESRREKYRERHQRAGRIAHHPSSTCFHPSLWPLTSAQPPSNTHTGIPFPCVKLTTHFCSDYKTHTQYLICWHTLHHSTQLLIAAGYELCVCVCVCEMHTVNLRLMNYLYILKMPLRMITFVYKWVWMYRITKHLTRTETFRSKRRFRRSRWFYVCVCLNYDEAWK